MDSCSRSNRFILTDLLHLRAWENIFDTSLVDIFCCHILIRKQETASLAYLGFDLLATTRIFIVPLLWLARDTPLEAHFSLQPLSGGSRLLKVFVLVRDGGRLKQRVSPEELIASYLGSAKRTESGGSGCLLVCHEVCVSQGTGQDLVDADGA